MARRGVKTPGMLTAGEISMICGAYLAAAGHGTPVVADEPPVLPPPKKRGRR